MARQVSAPDARRRSDDAVRRIRDESARRIERTGRVRAFSSWCALATLAGGLSLAALGAHETRLQERAQAEEAARQAAADKSLFEAKLRAIEQATQERRTCRMVWLELQRDERERYRLETEKAKRGKGKVNRYPY